MTLSGRPPDIPGPVATACKPKVRFPAKATDCHAHIFGPQEQFPLLPKTHFVPHLNPLADYIRMEHIIGCERGVLVQPSVYGPDNSLIIEALKSKQFDLRAIAVVNANISDRELEDLNAVGFRGIRINTASGTKGLSLADAPRLVERIKPMGWHLQFYVDLRVTPEIEQALAALKIDIVIDHFARISCAEGPEAPAFKALLRLIARDNCWAKLMGPYFISNDVPAFADIAPFAQKMIATAPDRMLWGSDWPHPSAKEKMPDDGHLADLLADWAPDEAQRKKILVDNPQRLYGFS